MNTVIATFDTALAVLRPAFLAVAVVLAAVSLFDWMVRTRRVNPFSRAARFARETVDPLFAPVERRIVRAGGNPVMAPFWALALAVLGGIVVISLIGFVRDQVLAGMLASQRGMAGIGFIVLRWAFQILRLALIVRVLCSWIRVSPYSPWVRWAFTLSEPMLRPLRQIIPTLGMVDITPIVAWLVLSLLERLIVQAF